MVLKKQAKVIQMLSPENYIRQKARTLPVYECLVNRDWDKTQIANLVVARRHTNGNVTAGVYLVDLACLGVKDTIWFFNISETEYRERLEGFFDMRNGVDRIDYLTAHNIVYAGISFAEEYEFKPHKDFTSITKYILDEDTEDIPIIEIECGIDGLPAYMPGPLHNDSKAKQVIAHLERVVGPGNYYLIDEEGMVMNDEDSDTEEDEFANWSLEDKRNKFAVLYKRMNQLSDDEAEQLFTLTQSIVDDLLDSDSYEEYIDEFDQELSDIEVDDEVIPDELLGVETGGVPLPSEIKAQFLEILEMESDVKTLKKQLAKFKKTPDIEAASAYLEMIVAELEESKAYDDLLKEAAKKYPHYGLVQIRWAETAINTAISENKENISFQYDSFFNGRNSIHSLEFFNYLHLRTLALAHEANLEKLEAWKDILLDFNSEETDLTLLIGLTTMTQFALVAKRLKIE